MQHTTTLAVVIVAAALGFAGANMISTARQAGAVNVLEDPELPELDYTGPTSTVSLTPSNRPARDLGLCVLVDGTRQCLVVVDDPLTVADLTGAGIAYTWLDRLKLKRWIRAQIIGPEPSEPECLQMPQRCRQ